MTTLIGSVDHLFAPNTNVMNEAFTTIFNFLTSSEAQAIGVQRIAYHSGASPGTGVGFHNETPRFGNNAWACFKFASASIPFYALFQYCEAATNFGAAPGSPAAIAGLSSNAIGTVGWSVAFLENGQSPWNGTTGSNGSDSKGTPVWVSGSSSLYAFPRSNAQGGSFATNRNNMSTLFNQIGSGFNMYAYTHAFRMHMFADSDNIMFMMGLGNLGTYLPHYFGKYYAPQGAPPNSVPYFMMSSNVFTDIQSLSDLNNVFGPLDGQTAFNGAPSSPTSVATCDGGIAFNNTAVSGVLSFVIDFHQSTKISMGFPNIVGFEKPQFELRNLFLIARDTNRGLNGFLGHSKFFGVTQGIGPNAFSHDKKWIAMGGAANHVVGPFAHHGHVYSNFMQWVVPWDGGQAPETMMTKAGRRFLRTT